MPNDFGVTLPDAKNIVSIPAAQKLPSGIGTGLRGLANNINTFQRSRDEDRRRKKEQARLDKEARETNAANETTRALALSNAGIKPFETVAKSSIATAKEQNETLPSAVTETMSAGGNDTTLAGAIVQDSVTNQSIDPAELQTIEGETMAAAKQIASTQTAVSQGNLPSLASEAQIDRLMLQLMNRHPGQEAVIAAQMKKLGVDNALFNEIKDDIKLRENDRDAALAVRTEEYKIGAEDLGIAGKQLTPSEIRAHGSQLRQDKVAFDRVKESISLEAQKQDLTIKSRKEGERVVARETEQVFRQQLRTTLAPYLTAYNRLLVQAGEPGSNPVLEKELEELRFLITTKIGTATENLIGEFNPDAATADALRKESSAFVENTFLNPLAERDVQTSNLIKKFDEKYKLDATLSLPFINALKGTGLNIGSIDALMLNMPKPILDKLQDELRGLASTDPSDILSRNSAKLYLTEIMSVLQGDKRLSEVDFDSASASEYFNTLKGVKVAIDKQIQTGDTSNGQQYMNALEVVSVAAGELNSANGDTVNMKAAEEILRQGYTKKSIDRLLKSPEHAEEARIAAIGARAAAAKVSMNLQTVNKTEGFWSLKWDANTTSYRAVFDNKGFSNVSNKNYRPSFLGGSTESRAKPPLPPRLQRLGASLNGLTNFLADTGEWDESTPQASHKELKEFYGRGKIPASLAKELEASKASSSQGNDAVQQAQLLKQQLKKEDFKLEVPNLVGEGGVKVDNTGAAIVTGSKGQEIRQPTATAIRQAYGSNQYAQEIEEKSNQMGLNPDVILSLVYRESGFKPGANKGDPKAAQGLMQVMPRSWDTTAVERYGKPVAQLSPSENIDLGLYIFQQNLEKSGGDYKDALAMYHSGKSYSAVQKSGVSDGLMKSSDYVDIIIQGSKG